MDEPDWAKILRYLHNHNGEIRSIAEFDGDFEEEPSNEDHEHALYDDLRGNIDLENTEAGDIAETHKHLQNTGLVNFQQRSDHALLSLTPDGFDVAHERELSRRNNRINHSLVFLTFFLVLAQVVGVVPIDNLLKSGAGLLILVGMLYIVARTDLLGR